MNRKTSPEKKILTRQELLSEIHRCRQEGLSIVFTNGCFDIIHRGHVEHLFAASGHGDILIIGVNSDSSVRKLKGEPRPLQDQDTRSLVLASFYFVDYVVVFDELTPYELIAQVKPDVLAKGGDYRIEDIVGNEIVREKGGKVITTRFIEGYSSSALIKRMGDS